MAMRVLDGDDDPTPLLNLFPATFWRVPADSGVFFQFPTTFRRNQDGMPVWIKDDEVEEEVAGEVSRMPKLRNNMSTNIKFEEVDNEVETSI